MNKHVTSSFSILLSCGVTKFSLKWLVFIPGCLEQSTKDAAFVWKNYLNERSRQVHSFTD